MASIFDSNPGPLPFQPTGLWGNNFAQYNRPYMNDLANRPLDVMDEIRKALEGTEPGYQNPFIAQGFNPPNQGSLPNYEIGFNSLVRPPAPQTPASPTTANPTINPQPNGALGSAFGSALSGSLNQLRNLPQNTPPTAPTLNSQQQNWMNANSSGWGDDLMNFMLGGGGNQFNFDPMNIQWTNFSNGAQENITRALGIIQSGGANALARILGGTVEASPFATFGTQQRDQMIRMPNGQMIDASAFANALRGASQSSNPFSSLSDVIGLYQRENAAFNPQTNTDAVNLVNRGVLNPNAPPGWDPSKFAGGNPTFTPSGPVPGNPSNPGMGTSNPVQFQGGQINGFIGPNGFPVFNTPGSVPQQPSMPQTNTPQMPQPPQFPGTGMNTPQQPAAPQGTNTNWQYYMPQGRQSLFGSPGLYAQPGGAGGGMTSGGGMQNPGNGSSGGNTNPANPFGTPRPSNNNQVAGNLPNGSTVLGNR